MLRKIFVTYLLLSISVVCSFAYELDMSVDEEIKKKYDSSKLNYDVLPSLPKVNSEQTTTTQTTTPKTQASYPTSVPMITKIDSIGSVKIPKGTKFQVKSNNAITDRLKEGTNVSFTTVAAVYKKGVTIPAGTKFTGTIIDSHTPQMSGNGGLVVIRVDSIAYGGKHYSVNGKITKANYKKIFLNNIKGKHQYFGGVKKQVAKGESFYKKSRQISNKMSNNSISAILSPIPTITGAVGCAVCTVASPLTGLTNKGGSVSIPSGSPFEIKLCNDAYVK